jgi:hypothetical protein
MLELWFSQSAITHARLRTNATGAIFTGATKTTIFSDMPHATPQICTSFTVRKKYVSSLMTRACSTDILKLLRTEADSLKKPRIQSGSSRDAASWDRTVPLVAGIHMIQLKNRVRSGPRGFL